MPSDVFVSRIGLHAWEEPVISGTRGSGTVFFSGCSLGCSFCQNREISRGAVGRRIGIEELSQRMLELEHLGAHNINFVTPTHYSPSVREAVELARGRGLSVPIVYNTGSYDTVEALRALDGTVDVYLPDMKYYRSETAKRLAGAENYPTVALAAIAEMVRQQPTPAVHDGIMEKGVIVRFLLLPGHVAEAKLALRSVYNAFGNNVYYSLMSQYTPLSGMAPPLDRRVTRAEYLELVEYADRIGVENGFTQGEDAAAEAYIPEFDLK
ncbi:MAG: radical SAM protein [Clostridia bacterium]|nr:radical SAM protein [Clostridia bacterium]